MAFALSPSSKTMSRVYEFGFGFGTTMTDVGVRLTEKGSWVQVSGLKMLVLYFEM